MSPHDFIRKWRNVELKERTASQSHFNDLCAAIGFDYVAALPMAVPFAAPLRVAYSSFEWQVLLVPALLIFSGQSDRAWRLMNAAGITLAATAAIFPFFPALDAVVYFGINRATFAPAISERSWYFPVALNAIRSGEKTIDPSLLTGLVSFPSFHASAAFLFTWGCWRTRFRWAFVALNAAMCVSAVFIGAHYLADVLAGLLIAVIVVACVNSRSDGGGTIRHPASQID